MDILAQRVKNIKPSPTLAISAKAKELKSQGIKVISLSTGEPDFDTPEHIKNAAIAAIKQGQTKYTNVDGTTELKQAIINKFKRDNNLEYQLDEVTASTGGKQVIYNALMASINEGDEVIIPAPYWVSYPDMVTLAGGKPIIVNTKEENNFCLTAEELRNNITNRTKWVILNSPSNPTGQIYSYNQLTELAEELLKHPQIHILSDDIYEYLVYDNAKFYNIVSIKAELQNRTLIVNGVSKSYSMTGWRLGFGAGPKNLIKAMNKIQSQSTSNPSSISQAAALEALTANRLFLDEWRKEFINRRNFVVEQFNNIKGLQCFTPNGAFYAFINCQKLIGTNLGAKQEPITDDAKLAEILLQEAKVAVVPGSAFGSPGFFRISYATSMENLEKAVNQIKNVIDS